MPMAVASVWGEGPQPRVCRRGSRVPGNLVCTPRRRCKRCSDSPVSQQRGFHAAACFGPCMAPFCEPCRSAAPQPSSNRFTHACICRRAGEALRRRRRRSRRSRRPQQASLAAAPSSTAAPSPATPRRRQEAQNALLPRWRCCGHLLSTAAPAAAPPACKSAERHGGAGAVLCCLCCHGHARLLQPRRTPQDNLPCTQTQRPHLPQLFPWQTPAPLAGGESPSGSGSCGAFLACTGGVTKAQGSA